MHNQFPCVKNNGSFRRTTRSAKKNRFSQGNVHAKNLTMLEDEGDFCHVVLHIPTVVCYEIQIVA